MSVNKVILVGSLGKAPELKRSKNDKDYATFSLATNKKWKSSTGEKQEKVAWHYVKVFGGLVKVCDFLETGSKIYLEGEIDYSDQDINGKKIQTASIVGSSISIIKGKNRLDKNNQMNNTAYAAEQSAEVF